MNQWAFIDKRLMIFQQANSQYSQIKAKPFAAPSPISRAWTWTISLHSTEMWLKSMRSKRLSEFFEERILNFFSKLSRNCSIPSNSLQFAYKLLFLDIHWKIVNFEWRGISRIVPGRHKFPQNDQRALQASSSHGNAPVLQANRPIGGGNIGSRCADSDESWLVRLNTWICADSLNNFLEI